jgi:putative (di)nucleoside polyphosphate hydrolase
MIDQDGYRPNVGIVLCNQNNQVFWARRCGRDGWQFPQGGVQQHEAVEVALFRELREEVGLDRDHVEVLGRTHDWLRYEIPEPMRRPRSPFRGQKQIWFLLRFLSDEHCVCLNACERPEFDAWRWVDYWSPVEQIIEFKRDVYRRALTELEPLLRPL